MNFLVLSRVAERRCQPLAGDDLQVLIGQFTTTGELGGQVYSPGLQSLETVE